MYVRYENKKDVLFEGWELESSDLGKRVILYKKTAVINNLKKLNKYNKI